MSWSVAVIVGEGSYTSALLRRLMPFCLEKQTIVLEASSARPRPKHGVFSQLGSRLLFSLAGRSRSELKARDSFSDVKPTSKTQA